MRLRPCSTLLAASSLAAAVSLAGCSQKHEIPLQPDAGAPEQELPSDEQPSPEPTVELAPSGASVEPEVTVMASDKFQLIGSTSASSGATSTSVRYQLRSNAFERLR